MNRSAIRLILFVLSCVSLSSCVAPAGGGLSSGRDSGGEAFIALEEFSGKVVSSHNETAVRPIGSLAQIANAIVVFDWATATGRSLAEKATVTSDVLTLGGANPMGLQPGDEIALRDALYSMLLGSDNASALTLANYVGGQVMRTRGSWNAQPAQVFVSEMNQLAGALGMRRTRFINVHGMDTPGQNNTSTAEDLARLAVYAMRHPGLAFYTKQKSRAIGYTRGGQPLSFRVSNTNRLVGTRNIDGLRAGQSLASGPCLIISAAKAPIVQKLPDGKSNVTPRRMVVVVLNSPNREGWALSQLDNGWALYEQWASARAAGIVPAGQPQRIITVPKL